MDQEVRGPENLAVARRKPSHRARLRRACYMLLAAGVGIASYVILEPRSRELPLAAGSGEPFTQPMLQPEPALELPPPANIPIVPMQPEFPQVEMLPDETRRREPTIVSPPKIQSQAPQLGRRTPEVANSPTPAELGLVDGVFLGHPVQGLHPELLRRLQTVGASPSASGNALGVESISGYRTGSRAHSQGLAVDVNYFANPYIMHESGEAVRDQKLAAVYERISQLILGRPSVIPEEITTGTPSPARTLHLYRALRDESRAMTTYFRLMQDRAALRRFLATRRMQPGDSPESLQQQMAEDYVTLSGRAGPPVPGVVYPLPETADGDPPFAGDSAHRRPELGFMNLREELVRAFTDAGLRWGGTDMGANSGDLMHFYLPDPEPK